MGVLGRRWSKCISYRAKLFLSEMDDVVHALSGIMMTLVTQRLQRVEGLV